MPWLERLSGAVVRRRAAAPAPAPAPATPPPALLLEGVETVVEEADEEKEKAGRDADGVVALAVSTAEKEKGLASLLSTGPADSGGVAVMVLGNGISCKLATAGEIGWAVRGVSR